MEHILVYVPFEKYLGQWLVNRLGSPVAFPARSNENAILARYIQRPPSKNYVPALRSAGIPVRVPIVHGKNPYSHTHLSRQGETALIAAVELLFRMDLWYGLAPLLTTRGINAHIDRWCEQHGIALYYREAVRQKFYRIRKDYLASEIILGKKHRKKIDYKAVL